MPLHRSLIERQMQINIINVGTARFDAYDNTLENFTIESAINNKNEPIIIIIMNEGIKTFGQSDRN